MSLNIAHLLGEIAEKRGLYGSRVRLALKIQDQLRAEGRSELDIRTTVLAHGVNLTDWDWYLTDGEWPDEDDQ